MILCHMILYRDENADVVVDRSTDSQSANSGDHDADTDGDVTGREDEVELVVDVDELLERGVSAQPDSNTQSGHS